MSVFIEKPCDYRMPCGWCELREMMCPTVCPPYPYATWQGATTNPMAPTTTYAAGKMDGGEE